MSVDRTLFRVEITHRIKRNVFGLLCQIQYNLVVFPVSTECIIFLTTYDMTCTFETWMMCRKLLFGTLFEI